MGKILIINGSPRAPRSHSARFAQIFGERCKAETEHVQLLHADHVQLTRKFEDCSDVLFVFPLYADGVPAILLEFLKSLSAAPPTHRPVLSVLINCGFQEPWQNDSAVAIMRCFAHMEGYPFGSVLKVGSGEAILSTPFVLLVNAAIIRLARAVTTGRHRELQVSMPMPKWMFIKASRHYWIEYGRRNGIDEASMASLLIEDKET